MAVDIYKELEFLQKQILQLRKEKNVLEERISVLERKKQTDDAVLKSQVFEKIMNDKPKRNQDMAIKDVYLMRNKDGFTKIGIATNPQIRERTLQAEEPSTELLYVCSGGGIAMEKSLHNLFTSQGKHHRGEWFKLDDNDYKFLLENFSFFKPNFN